MKTLHRKWQICLSLYLFIYLAIHLYTLSISPLPWFDETYMASIANEFIETGQLFPKIAQVRQMAQELIYGPVYFAISGLFIKLFGLAAFPFRLTAFVSGLLVVWASFRLFKRYNKSIKLPLFFAITLSLDPFLNRSMHEGRMDLLALFFVLMASEQFIRFAQKSKQKRIVFAAIFSLLALLTTPRTGFFFTAWAIIWLSWLLTSWRNFLVPALSCLAIVLVGYSAWIVYAFGSFTKMFAYYGEYLMFTRLNLAETSIMKQQYLLILLGAGSFLIGLVRFRRKYINTTTGIAALSILTFYTMVFDQGPYAVFIVPSYYLLIFQLIANFRQHQKIIQT